ncbi:MAG: hypothetical protein JNK82_08405 [Myxococcaceae bacterium]|nr:hypothetical protein [Myxococcaceae bacterium]
MTSWLMVLLTAAPAPAPASPAPLPDLPAPLGMLDKVLQEGGANGEKTVELTLPGCDHKVPVNASRFVGGTAYAMQQMVEWLYLTPGLKVLEKATLDELTQGVTNGRFVEQKACGALPKELQKAPKLCAGAGKDQAWMVANDKPVVSVRWAPASGADKCLPRLTGVLFDAKGVARVRYDADFGGAASGALLGDGCQITFTFDAANEVFHAARRGCKGP